jgi:Kef-type K+ transport system membrane component KefB
MAVRLENRAQRRIGRLLTLIIVSLLAALMRSFGPLPGPGRETMLLGFLLLSAFVAGELAAELRLPRITGYLLIGILFGPDILHLLPRETVEDFRLINGVALSVIALQAGGELRMKQVRPRLRSIGTITASQIVITLAGIILLVYLSDDLLPFLAGQSRRAVLAIALIFAVVAVAKSPATTIAVITEVHARGRLTDTVLGVSVLKDVIILLLIAAVIPAAAVLVDPGRGFDYHAVEEIAVAILASLALGALLGWLVGQYMERFRRGTILFVLGLAFVIVEVGQVMGLEYILVGMTTGFVIQNFTAQGPTLLEALEVNSLPIYALFFAVAGAGLELSVIPMVWRVGVLIIAARMGLVFASTYLGAVLAGEPQPIRRYAWMGFLAKAGVTLGLANMVRERFTPWGDEVAAIIIAMIAVNQLVGPPLFRFALDAAGESHATAASL